MSGGDLDLTRKDIYNFLC